jgi:hypothetical protein
MPLNIFVTVALMTGVSSARHLVFAGCAMGLVMASIACAVVLVKRGEDSASPPSSVETGNTEREHSYTD